MLLGFGYGREKMRKKKMEKSFSLGERIWVFMSKKKNEVKRVCVCANGHEVCSV